MRPESSSPDTYHDFQAPPRDPHANQHTFQTLIKRFTKFSFEASSTDSGLDHLAKPKMISPKNNLGHHSHRHHHHQQQSQKSFAKSISNLFSFHQPSLALDHQSASSPSSVESFNDLKLRPNDLVLNGFLKNNGGYLDDSDESDLDDEPEDDRRIELDRQDHPIEVLGKYRQNASKTHHPQDHLHHRINRHSATRVSLPLQLSHRHHHHHHHHHHHSQSTLINQPIHSKSNGHHRCISSWTTDHLQHPDDDQCDKLCPLSVDHDERIKDDIPRRTLPDRSIRSHQPINGRYSFKTYHHLKPGAQVEHHRARSLQGHRREDRINPAQNADHSNINLQYIQSSTFPIQNSIVVDPRLHHGRASDGGYHHLNRPIDSSNCTLDECRSSPIDLHRNHHDIHLIELTKPRNQKSKSPFRSLVLGQDDLLRMN